MKTMVDNSLFKLDIHTHILPRDIPDWKREFGYGGFITLDHNRKHYARMMLDNGDFFRDVFHNLWDPEVRIDEMDNLDVNVQVLSTVPVMFSYWAKPKDTAIISRFLNDEMTKIIEQYPTRFTGLGTLPMNDTELALEELDRCKKELNLPGIILGTHIPTGDAKINLHDDRLYPIFKRAQQLNTSIFIHPWNMPWLADDFWAGWLAGMPAETTKAINNLIFGSVFLQLPRLKFAFAHCGGNFAGTIGRIEHGFNVRPDLFPNRDTNPRNYIHHFWVDTLTADPDVLRYNMTVYDKNKIILGSDYPFPLGESEPGKMILNMEDITKEEKAKILGTNGLEWLGLEKEQFNIN